MLTEWQQGQVLIVGDILSVRILGRCCPGMKLTLTGLWWSGILKQTDIDRDAALADTQGRGFQLPVLLTPP